MIPQPTVYVIDDDQAVRDSLVWLLESVGLTVSTYSSATAFIEDRVRNGQTLAGCAVVDIRLPGMSGLDLQDALSKSGIELPVIIITGHGDVPVAVRAMKAGAVDFIEKPFNDQLLLDRVREALERDQQRQHKVTERQQVQGRLARLTPRERQVMDLVIQGKLNKQIAAQLNLSPKTVEVHRAHVMDKMEAGSLAELVRITLAAGIGPATP